MNPLQEPAEFVVHRALEETVSGFNRAHLWFCDLDEDCQRQNDGDSDTPFHRSSVPGID